MRTRVKICGLTREADLAAAVAAGADAVGLVFHRSSPRYVEPDRAAVLCRSIPAFVTVVGLFLDEDPGWVRQVVDAVPLELLQFHGTESPEYCQSFRRRYMKALGLGGGDASADPENYRDAAGILVDAHAPGEQGGTGQRLDWTRLPDLGGRPWVLAGGLTPANVAEAVRTAKPYAVDVSSGVEASPGVKDPAKINAFIDEVNRVR